MAFVLVLLAVTSGTLLTYLYDDDASFAARLCSGGCVGLTLLSLVGYILAAQLNLNVLSVCLTAVVIATPLLLLKPVNIRKRVARDVLNTKRDILGFASQADNANQSASIGIAHMIVGLLLAVVLWLSFSQEVFEQPDGIYTGVTNNYGDLPLHLSIVSGFVYGENFPPVHPELASTGLTYPFLVDFASALLMGAGATITSAFFWINIVLAFALAGLMYRFTLQTTGNNLAALFATLLLFFNGGLGWLTLLYEILPGNLNVIEVLRNLPHDYTININGLRWGNSLTSLLLTQRSILLGIPLALIVMTLWWQVVNDDSHDEPEDRVRLNHPPSDSPSDSLSNSLSKAPTSRAAAPPKKTKAKRASQIAQSSAAESADAETRVISKVSILGWQLTPSMRRMIGAGIIAGLLPLAHAHTFAVLMGVGGCLALVFRQWRLWIVFFAVACLIAVPQILWLLQRSDVQGEAFIGWHFGWDREEEENVVLFWIRNTGLFIPFLMWALWKLGRRSRRNDTRNYFIGLAGVVRARKRLLFYLPFTLCFVVPNMVRLAPWVWDNIKVLFYWYVASVPLVALVLARWWQTRDNWYRVPAIAVLLSLTLAGALDVWRVISKATQIRVYDNDAIAFAEVIKRTLPPRALTARAPTHDHPVLLTGRRSLTGYGGHLATHGLHYEDIEKDLFRIYRNDPSEAVAKELIKKHGIEYVIYGPQEREVMKVKNPFVNRYPEVGAVGEYHVYKTSSNP